MKKIFVVILAIVIGLALASAGFAADTDKTASSKTFMGTVTSVDTSAKNIVVKGKGGDKTFDVSDTKWKSGYSSLDDIKAGDKVTVMYTEKDGNMMAKSVMKSGTKTKKTTTKSTTTETQTDSSDTGTKK
jgi:hypothetical protein